MKTRYVLQNLQTGEEIALTGVVRIGRTRENTIVLDDEMVSKFHATIWEDNHRLYIRDEGSTNGTLVNGQPITQPALLEPGMQVQIGTVTFVLKTLTAGESASPSAANVTAPAKSFLWIPLGITLGVVALALMALFIRSNGGGQALLPTVTPSPEVMVLATPLSTPTADSATRPLPTSTSTSTPRPVTVSPARGVTPTTGTIYPAPVLVSPADGSSHQGSSGPVLSWSSRGDLSGEEYYRISVDYPHEGKTWREVGWSQHPFWQVPDYLPLLLSGPNDCHWTVQVVRVTGKDAAGTPIDSEPLSPPSEVWTFLWKSNALSPVSPAPTESPLLPPAKPSL